MVNERMMELYRAYRKAQYRRAHGQTRSPMSRSPHDNNPKGENEMRTITHEEIVEGEWWSSHDRATHPLYSELLPADFVGTARDVLSLREISPEDKVWFALFGAGRRGIGRIEDNGTLDEFSSWCVAQAEAAARTPNQAESAAAARRNLSLKDPAERAWNACVDAGWAHAPTIFTSQDLNWEAFGDKAVGHLLEILPPSVGGASGAGVGVGERGKAQ